jgi:GT2 family glycosyltransferase
MNAPKISLCIPTYNRPALLRQCVTSLLAQTTDDCEVVVVDNCSGEETAAVVAAFLGHPRFRFHRNDANIGPQRNWNRCVELARGEHIAICHDDDFYAPAFAAASSAFLDAHSSVGFVHCAYRVTDSAGRPIRQFKAYASDQVIPSRQVFVQYLRDSHNVVFSSVMARRGAYATVGEFRDGLICGDYDMWLRMALHFDVGYLARRLVYYRTHDDSLSREVPLRRWYEEHVRIIDFALSLAAGSMPGLDARRDEFVAAAGALWARRGLREALSRGADGHLEGAREYCAVADSLAITPGLRAQTRITRLLLSPAGTAVLRLLRPAWHRVRHTGSGDQRASRRSHEESTEA